MVVETVGIIDFYLERAKGFEPSTPTLARRSASFMYIIEYNNVQKATKMYKRITAHNGA